MHRRERKYTRKKQEERKEESLAEKISKILIA
jgi:hypothetical protein